MNPSLSSLLCGLQMPVVLSYSPWSSWWCFNIHLSHLHSHPICNFKHGKWRVQPQMNNIWSKSNIQFPFRSILKVKDDLTKFKTWFKKVLQLHGRWIRYKVFFFFTYLIFCYCKLIFRDFPRCTRIVKVITWKHSHDFRQKDSRAICMCCLLAGA